MSNMRNYVLLLSVWLPALLPASAAALEIEIQGTTMTTESISDLCINIAGEYAGVTIENSVAGKLARICHQSKQNDLVVMGRANFVATQDNVTVTVRFKHEFAPGLNGPTIGRASVKGFFASSTGTTAPSGDTVSLSGYLNQGSQDALMSETMSHTVGSQDDLESAVYDLSTEQNFLIAGRRTVKGELTIKMAKAGNQMVLQAIRVSLDPPWFTRPREAE